MIRPPFVLPEFLNGQSVSAIRDRMLGVLPPNVDKSPEQYPWDLATSMAIEKAHMAEFILPRAIRNMFPLWADETASVDANGTVRGMTRKAANAATGMITVTSSQTMTLPAGSKFSTVSNFGIPSVVFVTTKDVVIDVVSDVPIEAEIAGYNGNVAANSITMLVSPINGVVGVNNAMPKTLGQHGQTVSGRSA